MENGKRKNKKRPKPAGPAHNEHLCINYQVLFWSYGETRTVMLTKRQKLGQSGPLALIFEIFSNKALFRK